MKMIQKGGFRVCFQPITMLNCCTWEIGSYNTQQSRHNEHMHFCRKIRNMASTQKSLLWKFISQGADAEQWLCKAWSQADCSQLRRGALMSLSAQFLLLLTKHLRSRWTATMAGSRISLHTTTSPLASLTPSLLTLRGRWAWKYCNNSLKIITLQI